MEIPNEVYAGIGTLLVAIISWLLGVKKGKKK
jgi:hypothetical protein